MKRARILSPVVLLLGLASIAVAQTPKRPLTQADWDGWRSISGMVLSADGKWAAYTLTPQVGDGELVVRATDGSTEYRVPRGYLGRPNNVPGGLRPPRGPGQETPGTGPGASPPQFSADMRFVLVMVQPSRAEVERLETQRGRNRGVPRQRNSLAILDLTDGKVTVIPEVRSFRLPRENGGWVAYLAEPDSGSSTSPRRTFGSPLMLRNLASGIAERFNDVRDYAMDDSARVLAYTVVSRDSTRDGAFFRSLRNGSTVTLASGRGDYQGIILDRSATQAAFLSNRAEFGSAVPRFTLFHAMVKGAAEAPGRKSKPMEATVTSAVEPRALPSGFRVSDRSSLSFTKAGNAILLGVAPELPDSVPADSLVGKAVFDLWHWKDPRLQPSQRLSAARDRNRAFQAIWFTGNRKLVQLANDSIPEVDVSDDGKTGFAASVERYRIETMWGDGGTDVYGLDPTSGAMKMIREKISGPARLSPDGKYVAFFDKGHWYSYNLSSGKTVDLTGGLTGVRFDQETWDTPSIPDAWGIAGWTKGDKSLLLYDRWDIWELDPQGSRAPIMVTDSLGRKEGLVFRIVPVQADRAVGGGGRRSGAAGREDEPVDPSEPLLLRAVNEDTRASGFYRDRLGVRQDPQRIVMADAAFGDPIKAGKADQWLLTRGTFVEFPNLWTGPSLDALTRISDANPQQKDVNWGTVELVRWTSADGIPLKGLLFKPEDFDSTRKYPLIAYFYEQLSQNLNNYAPPNGRNVINPTHYASNGYLVFEPDIAYQTGYPGPSALKSVVPGVQSLIARGFVDPRRLGIQGQSWGGYQTSYIITQTGMFAAAMAGAPVVNMTSAYGGIRWESGVARPFQYEIGQSRIGGSLWEAPMRYFENSPLFWLDRITTPLFIMSNDADGAVPWYQGIEFFVGMRRLGKEVYLIDYNNDIHNPASRANQKDIAMRMQQFFDTKLKGAPAPDWMVRGIPYLAKGRDQLQPPKPASAGSGGEKP